MRLLGLSGEMASALSQNVLLFRVVIRHVRVI
jgi:hypothetical protein